MQDDFVDEIGTSPAQLVEAFLSGQAQPATDAIAFQTELLQHVSEASPALAPIRFAHELGNRAPAQEASMALKAIHCSDVALALLATDGHHHALEIFDRLLRAQVRIAVANIDSSLAFCDEVAQVLRLRLLLGSPPGLSSYAGRGSLAAWLRVSALRAGLELRAQTHGDRDESLMQRVTPERGPEFEFIRARYRTEFRSAFASALAALPAQTRNLLRLHYLEGISLLQMGKLYGLHRTTVARRLDEARQSLFDETRRLIFAKLAIGREEFEGLIALLRSQLDVSIRRLLAEGRA